MKARVRIKLWDSPFHFPIMVFVYLIFSIGIGAVMYYLIEKPALNFRARISPRPLQVGTLPQPAAESQSASNSSIKSQIH